MESAVPVTEERKDTAKGIEITKKGRQQKMNLTTWALLVLSVLNTATSALNLIFIKQRDHINEEIDNFAKQFLAKISDLDERIDGESDTICRLIDDHRKLKQYAERTYLIALYAYNAEKKREIRWKNCRKHMQEAEEREDAEN